MQVLLFENATQSIRIDFEESEFSTTTLGSCKLIAFGENREIIIDNDFADFVIDTLLISLADPKELSEGLLNKLGVLFNEYCFKLWHRDSFRAEDATARFSVFRFLFFYRLGNEFEFEVSNGISQPDEFYNSYERVQEWLRNQFYFFRIKLTTEDVSVMIERLKNLKPIIETFKS